jgi:PadR family transcriptional regulator, regulatory protein PadR
MNKTNPSFLNGVPELLLLRLLSRREMYGYEIVRAIQSETKEIFSFGEGCIYPYLHYLEKEKLVGSRRKEVDGRSRHYYKLTARGAKRLAELSAEWDRVAEGITLIMEGSHA